MVIGSGAGLWRLYRWWYMRWFLAKSKHTVSTLEPDIKHFTKHIRASGNNNGFAYKKDVDSIKQLINVSILFQRKKNACSCGSKKTDKPKCTTNVCPCFVEERSCTFCKCRNCNNPNGKKNTVSQKQFKSPNRSVQPHFDTKRIESKEILKGIRDLPSGPWSSDETFLLAYLISNGVHDLDTIYKDYSLRQRCLQNFLCIDSKSKRSVQAKYTILKASYDVFML